MSDAVLNVEKPLIHRDRLSSLFGFEYRIERYVTAAKREVGYFCRPLRFGERFVGRIDCKAHRAEGRLEVLSLHLEEGAPAGEAFFQALGEELQRFAEFDGCPQLDAKVVEKVRRSPRGSASVTTTRS